MKHVIIIGCLAVSLAFIGAACTLPLGERGAVMKSLNQGETWRSASLMRVGNRKVRSTSALVTRIVVDPRNSNRLFLGTAGDGLSASENAGEDWYPLLPREHVTDILLDPAAPCTLYVATLKRIMRTLNCAESWEIVLHETREEVVFSSLAIDHFSSTVIYTTTTAGDIYRSGDNGGTWSVLSRIDQPIARLIVDGRDPSLLFVASTNGLILRSPDKGIHWEKISGPLALYDVSLAYTSLSSLAKSNAILYASEDGIFTTADGGKRWQRVPLLTQPGQVDILAVATNPQNDREMYYATTHTFYHTEDFGAHWEAFPRPTRRAVGVIAIDSNNPATLYVGASVEPREAGSGQKYWRFSPLAE